MRAPDFWNQNTFAAQLAGRLLAPLGMLYGASVAWKAKRAAPYRPKAKVVCVGNLTAGGSGKTPIAIAIAQALEARGWRPVFLSRGYGGGVRAPLLIEPATALAAEVGDEPLLLARVAPVIVARDRAAGAKLADEKRFDVIVMDDGHQNFSVTKDLAIVVVDAQTGFGHGRILPAGPLREPVAQGLARADAVVLAGDGNPALSGFSGAVLRARLVSGPAASLAGKPVVAFAGIGRPGKFFQSLRTLGAEIAEAHAYADHHVYTETEISRLKANARDSKAVLVTTEKDFVRLSPAQREGIEVLPVHATFDDIAARDKLLDSLGANSAQAQRR